MKDFVEKISIKLEVFTKISRYRWNQILVKICISADIQKVKYRSSLVH